MKGCLFFAAVFVLGVGLMVSGLVQDVMGAGVAFQDAAPVGRRAAEPFDRSTARVLEVTGLALVFGAIFGAAGWQFARRKREDEDESSGPR